MVKIILHIVFVILFIGAVTLAIYGLVSASQSAKRNIDIENTNKQLVKINTELESRNRDSLQTIERLTKSIGDAQATIKRYRELIAGAESGISEIDATIERLDKLSKQITN